MTEEEKKVITQEKHPGRIDQGHKLAALMKKRKEEILHSKEQSMVQPTESSVQGSVHYTVQSSVQSTVQSSVQSNDTYVYGVGILAVLSIGVCVFFAYSQAKNKKQANDRLTAQHEQKKDQPPKQRHML